jgi:hypothetical protein
LEKDYVLTESKLLFLERINIIYVLSHNNHCASTAADIQRQRKKTKEGSILLIYQLYMLRMLMIPETVPKAADTSISVCSTKIKN